jgi:hypothetical protein
VKSAVRLASIGFVAVAVVACQEDTVNPVWQAMCEAICTRGVECFPVDVDYGPCVSACLSDFGNEPCERNRTALDECVAGIGALSCTALDDGELPAVCDEVCTGPLCEGVDCDDENECTDDSCNASDGSCSSTPVTDGASCSGGACQNGTCGTVFPCTEQGIVDAIAVGGGPFTFACDAPTRIETNDTIRVTNDVILDGEGRLTIDGQDQHLVVSVARVKAEFRNLTVTHGHAVEGGSGIDNRGTLTLSNLIVTENAYEFGMTSGAIANSGTLTLNDSTISENFGRGLFNVGTATLTQSAVSEHESRRLGYQIDEGAGIYNDEAGVLLVIDSTISDNTAEYAGGGLFNAGIATLTNTTVSGNTSYMGGGIESGGGGILNYLDAQLTLINSTVSGNTAPDNGAGGIGNSGALTLIHNTVSRNVGRDIMDGLYSSISSIQFANNLVEGSCFVSYGISSSGHNIESPGDTCDFNDPTDQVSIPTGELNLGPLRDNGGPTLTQAPQRPSVAIDWIDPENCVDVEGQPLTTDQRGVDRPQGLGCDVGAVEVTQEP